MPSANLVVLLGNTGSDPEMRFTPSGEKITTFSLAVNKYFKDQNGERRQKTNWFRVKTFGKLADNCNTYLTKGKLVQVIGSVDIHEYEDTNHVKHKIVEVIANSVLFLWKPENVNGNTIGESDYNDSDEIPF